MVVGVLILLRVDTPTIFLCVKTCPADKAGIPIDTAQVRRCSLYPQIGRRYQPEPGVVVGKEQTTWAFWVKGRKELV